MKEQSYYSITTKKFTLRCGHPEWLQTTQDFYNRIVLFYYDLYLDQWESGQREGLTGQQALRKLEQLSIVGRDKQPVPYPLPWERVPLYFRRSAANKGIAAGRSYIARSSRENCDEQLKVGELPEQRSPQPGKARCFQEPVTYYKGMYRELSDRGVELKVWNGKTWNYLHCRLSANLIPEGATSLSPSVYLRGKEIYMNVPVRLSVQDGRKTKDRLREGTNVCTIQFAAGDAFAVCLLTDNAGRELGANYLHGADEYAQRCGDVLYKIEQSRRERGFESGLEEYAGYLGTENRRYWLKLKNISSFYSNNVSRQVINYCVDKKAGIIIIPEYEKQYKRFVMCKAGNWSGIHLGIRIREQICYKAWQEGILVLKVAPFNCGKICSVCGAGICRNGTNYLCSNGHSGNRYLNSARNLNKRFMESITS